MLYKNGKVLSMDKRVEYPKNGIILYGAGYKGQFAIEEVKGYGLQAIAFCDADEKKIGTNYCGLPVYSKEQVMKQYGTQFKLWISVLSPLKEQLEKSLVDEKFVTKDQIYNLKENKYTSCFYLRSVAVVWEDKIFHCCQLGDLRNQPSYVSINNSDWDETTSNFLQHRNQVIEDLKNGKKTMCDGCQNLENKYWFDNLEKISVLAISPNYPCQLSCKYCFIPSNAKNASKNAQIIQKAKELNIYEMMRVFEEKVLDLNEPIQLSGGEITILPNKKHILQCLSRYPLQIFSNCVVYDKSVSEIISRTDGSFLNVSIDAGTQKTYYEIKGMDVYETVLNNIRRYAKEGAIIEIKYILLPDNCDKENLDGFLLFCREIAPRCINVSCDFVADHTKLPQNILEAAIYMGQKAKEYHISCNILPYFGEQNMIKISQALQEGGTI